MADIILQGVSRNFEDRTVFDGLDLSFESGRRYILRGPSGCGKTTLLNLIAGILKPDKGVITFSEKPYISVVFQEDRLLRTFSSVENLCIIPGVSTDTALKELKSLIPDCDPWLPAGRLSGGQKRRLALLRALLVRERNILLMDEPFNGLDKESIQRAVHCILDKCGNSTLILASHGQGIPEFSGFPEILLTPHNNNNNKTTEDGNVRVGQ